MSISARLEPAQTTLEQLGGRRFILMTGATGFIAAGTTLRFRIPRRIIRITLDPSDTYTVQVITNPGGRMIGEEEGIYADGLSASFERLTGLCTSL